MAEKAESNVPGRHIPLVVGHRGNSGFAPENTAAAFAQAAVAGANMIETDVRLTADGELFLFHDETGVRTTNVAQVYPLRAEDPITSFTAGELRRLDAGAHFGPEYAGEPIVFLSELPAALGFELGVNLEIKSPASSPGVEQELALMLAGNPDWVQLLETQQLAVSSFDPASVSRLADLHLPAWQLVSTDPDAVLLAGTDPRVRGVVADHRCLTAQGAAAVRAAELGLWVYTVNSDADTAAVLALGVDAVITDFPGNLLAPAVAGGPADAGRDTSEEPPAVPVVR
ncbi:glycerophosphodiester phosphodiesterase family protein [Arthrobacter sp. YD2]|uniref:glycerophosphodiester phosphodiesterase n=1 Tax=Arthrobacter sp. YD2 TaxID=3058046 RepID=UPI0025B34F4D|nr:glycerophosphodiester phosphodiesterase family protein [Arthrobacter sp. YD2]MDN3905455.1 glycerophosphodiester phosphodiesterase family protein [Arthrobacter sp. YD2]